MQRFNLHSTTPQVHKIQQIITLLETGKIGLVPTDTNPALVCTLDNTEGKKRIQMIRNLDKNHLFTLIVHNLEAIAKYSHLSNDIFRLIKRSIPGFFTFILPATRIVPKILIHPKRKTVGIRVPKNNILLTLLKELNKPLMSVSLISSSITDIDYDNFYKIVENTNNQVDFYIDIEKLNFANTTLIDCCQNPPQIIRQGLGKL